MTRVSLIFAFIMLPSATMAQTVGADTCGAAGFQGLIGQNAEIARMLVLDQPARVITPGSIVTRDYRLERINFDVDEDDRIVGVYCG